MKDQDCQSIIVDRVDDPIVAYTDAILVFPPFEFLATIWSWVGLHRGEFGRYSLLHIYGQSFE
jgi:hypothetical protein